MSASPLVSIGIKALNEEGHIAAAVTSALASLSDIDGEVVLADSGSHDRTAAIALEFAARGAPVRVWQLSNPAERCCGIGAQLAYQQAQGEFFYLLDGDMVLDPAFISAGLAFLRDNPDYAAVGGRVIEAQTQSIEFELRARSDLEKGSALAGDVDRLDCGGLYRCAAIRSVGYFADRNLHAFEEFELGARLRAQGWKLARIDQLAVHHYGHAVGGYRLMLKRLRSGYAGGPGEVVRAGLRRRHQGQIVRNFSQLRNGIAVWAWWICLLASMLCGQWGLFAGLLAVPIAFLSWRRGGLRLGLYSLATWNVNAIGLIQGMVRARTAPTQPIAAKALHP
ncbi:MULTISPECIES: glycosyltransferase [unclassified Novosphingobium]|uniref:glycosyltransferase family 2 protein n=1 Tax=unclassified Novosphingobium TaxID=2644732 RepID=UPI0014946BFB|nr:MULTISPECIES: glycosyltransferase [unclassified Novosphingobium]MBB3360024.1 glycosyltransferase involved in cell wall biosynthesis [Novosphingobium sp. BK256]MBB3376383.1 glycosyltransferase involved in cell wall biosynthesis [Novosphingobium sp. BK280]MBB3380736.1 glycosyltransferase involved in cell wall biosynthesis [Novosphingobium sp. BK258]MBB3422448.1 glycosyltransferase involved in cell wall biosynthesis [Novosphingobium sp. BK267]MBB3451087.1 glycosyltransferase involved in cell w